MHTTTCSSIPFMLCDVANCMCAYGKEYQKVWLEYFAFLTLNSLCTRMGHFSTVTLLLTPF